MGRKTKILSFLLMVSVLLASTGCEKLQPGYYLTPGHVPTQPPTQTDVPTPVTPSPTPVSTVWVIGTPTLTPLPPPTLTPTPSPTLAPSPTNTIPPCEETEGQIVYHSFISQLTGREFHYRVYLPPCYSVAGRRYPYLIMLHGLGQGMDDSQWDRMGLDEAADLGYARGALPPMIIVMPNGNDAEHYMDNGPYPELIVRELMPAVEAGFCVWADSSHRAIGGLSRGGYWAFWIAFSHPDLFDRLGGHSPYFYDADYPSDFNPNNLVDTAPGIERLSIYLDMGAQDTIVDVGVHDFVRRLRRRGIEPEYVINPVGDHTEVYWSAHTADYLAFYAADWPRDVSQFPACEAASAP